MPKYFTHEGFEKLKKEIEYLKKDKRKEIAKQLRKAIAFGDLSENAAYHEAKEAQGFLEGKILELENLIKSAIIIRKNEKTDWVQIGSKVFVSSDNGKQVFEIVGMNESNPLKGKISYNSPLGKALLDKLKGAIIEVDTPKGKVKYKILKVE